jgi:translation initiation factor 1
MPRATGIGGSTDPFATGLKGRGKIHVRIQQRNGRKCITTVQGLDDDLDLRRIMRHMKKHCAWRQRRACPRSAAGSHPHPSRASAVNTNGSITVDDEMGEIIQLQGDQRDNVREWLLAQEVVTKQEGCVRRGPRCRADPARGCGGPGRGGAASSPAPAAAWSLRAPGRPGESARSRRS